MFLLIVSSLVIVIIMGLLLLWDFIQRACPPVATWLSNESWTNESLEAVQEACGCLVFHF